MYCVLQKSLDEDVDDEKNRTIFIVLKRAQKKASTYVFAHNIKYKKNSQKCSFPFGCWSISEVFFKNDDVGGASPCRIRASFRHEKRAPGRSYSLTRKDASRSVP